MFWRKKAAIAPADPAKEYVRRKLTYYYRLEHLQPLSEWQKGRKSALEAVWQRMIRK